MTCSACGACELNADHGFPRNSFDPAANVDLDVVFGAFQQGSRQTLLPALVILVDDINGEAPEGLKVSIRLEPVPDPGAADLQNIGLREQRSLFDGFSHRSTESRTVIQGDVFAIVATNLDLKSHRL